MSGLCSKKKHNRATDTISQLYTSKICGGYIHPSSRNYRLLMTNIEEPKFHTELHAIPPIFGDQEYQNRPRSFVHVMQAACRSFCVFSIITAVLDYSAPLYINGRFRRRPQGIQVQTQHGKIRGSRILPTSIQFTPVTETFHVAPVG